ncbi:MAG TPA: undecaprenyl-diphosphatase UppP [Bacteroidetes bacterium]|nr:undecaprenyl-diphosphatase UppP [Bacteroidota bacterium]
MTVFDAILLGLIQGLTEFIPISSTAHLTLAGKLLGLINSHNLAAWTEFIAVMQLGTLAAVVIYFSQDFVAISKGLASDLRGRLSGNATTGLPGQARMGWYVLFGTIPVALVGLLFNREIHGWFTKSTPVIIASLIGLAGLLWIAERVARHIRTFEDVTLKDALLIGFAQACALVPGSSRSGTTITAGLFLNFTRESAARFSFLLSIPAVLASGLHEMAHLDGDVALLGYGNLVIATLVAGISGYASIAWLIKYLSRNSAMLFVWYRFALGFLLIVLLWFGYIQP